MTVDRPTAAYNHDGTKHNKTTTKEKAKEQNKRKTTDSSFNTPTPKGEKGVTDGPRELFFFPIMEKCVYERTHTHTHTQTYPPSLLCTAQHLFLFLFHFVVSLPLSSTAAAAGSVVGEAVSPGTTWGSPESPQKGH